MGYPMKTPAMEHILFYFEYLILFWNPHSLWFLLMGTLFPRRPFFPLRFFGVWRFLTRPRWRICFCYLLFLRYFYTEWYLPHRILWTQLQFNSFNARQKPEIERDNLPDRSATSRQHHFYCELEIPCGNTTSSIECDNQHRCIAQHLAAPPLLKSQGPTLQSIWIGIWWFLTRPRWCIKFSLFSYFLTQPQ
jgi:hypothetical protein